MQTTDTASNKVGEVSQGTQESLSASKTSLSMNTKIIIAILASLIVLGMCPKESIFKAKTRLNGTKRKRKRKRKR